MSAPFLEGVSLASGAFGDRRNRDLGRGQSGHYLLPEPDECEWVVRHGFNAVRICFWWERMQPVPDGQIDEAAMAWLDESVSWLVARGVTVILGGHQHTRWCDDRDIIGQTRDHWPWVRFWCEVARRYAHCPLVWMAPNNEPVGEDLATLRRVYRDMLWHLREAAPQTMVLLGWPNWSNATSTDHNGAPHWMHDVPAVDRRPDLFAWDVHLYPDRTHNAGYTDERGEPTDQPLPCAAREQLTHILGYLAATEQRMILGEFNAPYVPGAPPAVNDRSWRWCTELRVLCLERPEIIGWLWWGLSKRFPPDRLAKLACAGWDAGGGRVTEHLPEQMRWLRR